MATTKKTPSLELLISGYIREEERKLGLYMHIPDGIDRIMHKFYPLLLFKFGECNSKALKITENGTVIEGTNLDCWGRLVYADLGQYSDVGLNHGVHIWSIKGTNKKCNKFSNCFSSIGVTTEKNTDLINNWYHRGTTENMHYWVPKGRSPFQSHYQDGYYLVLPMTLTIKLDCDNWTVTYYKNKEEFKKDEIKPNQSYYLAMLCCSMAQHTHLSVVESDDL